MTRGKRWGIIWAGALMLATCFKAEFDVKAQVLETPLEGRTVGLYLSKKGINFTKDYYQSFAAFLLREDSLDLSDENLKTAFTVALGNFLSRKFEERLGVDSVYYLNTSPAAVKAITNGYRPEGFNLKGVKAAVPEKVDYLLMIETFKCAVRGAPSLVTYSNRLYSMNRKVRYADVTLKLYDLRGNRPPLTATVRYSDDAPAPSAPYLTLGGTQTGAAVWISKVLDSGLYRLFNPHP